MTPNRLIHYRPFKEEHLVSLLPEGKLKLSRPDKFNDPWDCRMHYHVLTDPAGRERVIKHWTELRRKKFPHISEAKRALMAYEFKSTLSKVADGLDTESIVSKRRLMSHSCGGITPARILASVSNSTQGAHHLRRQKRSNTYPLTRLSAFSRVAMNLFSPNRRIGRTKPSGG
jgi:hypothetical protein